MASNDAQVIHALYHSMYCFMIERDVECLGSLLDDSFVLVHMTGRRQGKEEFLQCVADGTLSYFDEVEESCPVHVNGDTATLVGRSLVKRHPRESFFLVDKLTHGTFRDPASIRKVF